MIVTPLREAALLIQGWFPVGGATMVSEVEARGESCVAVKPPESTESDVGAGKGIAVFEEEGSGVNPPLTFVLKGLDGKHPYLKDRGLKPETIKHFGLGYCSRGLLKNRIAIPIHNAKGAGELVAYAGRLPTDDLPEGEEKYKMPGGFKKSFVLFNLNRVGESAREKGLILVEGFFSCFWLHQCGFPNVVALMGSSLSDEQKKLLVASVGQQGKITVLMDNDEAGRNCEAQCLAELCQHLFVKVVRLPEVCNQPDNLTEDQTHQLLA